MVDAPVLAAVVPLGGLHLAELVVVEGEEVVRKVAAWGG